MKKLSILLTGVLALAAFTACDEAPEAAKPQKNPQPAIFTNADVSAQLAAPLAQASTPGAEPLKLQEYREAGLITLMDNVSAINVPAGSEVVFDLKLSTDQAFPEEQTTVLTASTNEQGQATILTVDWNDAHYFLAGKSMTPRKFYYQVYGYVSLDETRYAIGEADPANPSAMVEKVFAQGEYEEVPFELIIDSAYYFLSDCTTWNFAECAPYKFDHTGESVYENPVFTFKFEVPADKAANGAYWKVASQTAVDTESWDAVYGPSINGDKSLSGKLIVAGQAGQITEAGEYTITINMEEMTYEIVKKTRPDFVVVASEANGWSKTDGKSLLVWSNKEDKDKQYFCGAAVANNANGGFKFVWDDNWFGLTADGTLGDVPDNIMAPVDDTRLYWFTVDTEALSYTIKEVTSMGLIGINGWDENNDVIEMTPSADYLTWTVDVDITAGFKILINHDWACNYGYNGDGELTFDTGNIESFSGNSTVTLSFAGNTPVLTVTPK